MPDIQLRQFDSYTDYRAFSGQHKKALIPAGGSSTPYKGLWLDCDMEALARSLFLVLRSYKNTGTDDDIRLYKYAMALLNVAFDYDTNTNKYSISNRYINMESSVKGSTSFLMGMTAAQIVANRIYRIPLLLHFSDPILKPTLLKGNRPDYFGLDDDGRAYLFEAKGTTGLPELSKVDEAVNQLLAVKSVRDTCTGKLYCFNTTGATDKTAGGLGDLLHAVVSGSDNGVLTFYDVDPLPSGEIIIDVDLDAAVLRYYGGLIRFQSNRATEGRTSTQSIDTGDGGEIKEDGLRISVTDEISRLVIKWRSIFESGDLVTNDDRAMDLNSTESEREIYLIGMHGEVLKIAQPARAALVAARKLLAEDCRESKKSWSAFVSSKGFESAAMDALHKEYEKLSGNLDPLAAARSGDNSSMAEIRIGIDDLCRRVDWGRIGMPSRNDVVLNQSTEELRLNNPDFLFSDIGDKLYRISKECSTKELDEWEHIVQEECGSGVGYQPSLFNAIMKVVLDRGNDGIEIRKE